MLHNVARVGDIVREIAKGEDAPEMRVWAMDGGGNLHCEWKGTDGRMDQTFDPAQVEMVSQRGPAASEGSAQALSTPAADDAAIESMIVATSFVDKDGNRQTLTNG